MAGVGRGIWSDICEGIFHLNCRINLQFCIKYLENILTALIIYKWYLQNFRELFLSEYKLVPLGSYRKLILFNIYAYILTGTQCLRLAYNQNILNILNMGLSIFRALPLRVKHKNPRSCLSKYLFFQNKHSDRSRTGSKVFNYTQPAPHTCLRLSFDSARKKCKKKRKNNMLKLLSFASSAAMLSKQQ